MSINKISCIQNFFLQYISFFSCLNFQHAIIIQSKYIFYSGDQWNMTGITLFANIFHISALDPCKYRILVGSMVWSIVYNNLCV